MPPPSARNGGSPVPRRSELVSHRRRFPGPRVYRITSRRIRRLRRGAVGPARRGPPGRLQRHRASHLRGHRAVRPGGGRVHRRGHRGDVHVHRPRRPLGDAAAGGHRLRRARGDPDGLDRGAVVKLCYAGPFFRYQRPQAAATASCSRSVSKRSESTTALDAEVIAIADARFRSWALMDSGWKSPRSATTPALRSTGKYCRTSCSACP